MSEYGDIIHRTYINPIRSVIALDDEFPALDQFVGRKASRRNLAAAQNEKARELLRFCRKKQWLVDFHDGTEVFTKKSGEGLVKHLHQTDLLILDFQLDSEVTGGDRAIRIVRELVRNPHFNIVVVYTKDDIEKVFNDISLSLLKPAIFPPLDDQAIETFFATWSDDDHAAVTAVRDNIDIGSYRWFRNLGSVANDKELCDGHAGLEAIKAAVGARNQAIHGAHVAPLVAILWLLKSFENKELEIARFAVDGADRIGFSPSLSEANWIRTDTLFLTVVSKDLEGQAILTQLGKALEAWRPTPHRLVISRFRAELEAGGSAVEETMLRDDRLQVGLLKKLTIEDRAARRVSLEGLMERHWTQIISEISALAMKDAERAIEIDSEPFANPDEMIRSHLEFKWFSPSDQKQKSDITFALNAYYSTKKVDGWHLNTGHIFRYRDSVWVCLSPACDLVPGQKSARWSSSLGSYRPFTAVKLLPVDPIKLGLEKANSNIFLYLWLGAERKCYRFSAVGDSEGEGNPDWTTLFALKEGKFETINRTGGRFISVRMLESEKIVEVPPTDRRKAMKLTPIEKAEVVGQLRYEYALNLLQRFGASLSRVGLDYTALK